MIGATVLHYRILKPLGAGGMGVVYEAEDTRLQRTVAIKFLGEEEGKVTPQALARFMQEARTASSLNHPNICTVHDAGEFEGRPYLVMERLHGETLKELLAKGPLGQERAIEILLQVAAALEAAHANGIVHRDIKPANIFITRDNQVKLLDFGIAKRVDAEAGTDDDATRLTQVGAVPGTVSYMSPEQALAKSVDWRTDFFSLGVVAYEMLSGRRPFVEETSPAIVDAIIHKPPDDLEKTGSGVSPALRQVVFRLLEKAPEKRHQSAADLIADLRRVQAGTPMPRRRFDWGGRRFQVAAAAVLGLVLLGALAIPLMRDDNSVSPEPAASIDDPATRPIVAVLRPDAIGGGATLEDVGLGIAYSLATSLSAVRSVTMISPAASLGQQIKGQDPREIARELGANYVVTGVVEQAGQQLRVSLNLLRGNAIVWGGSSSGDPEDLFALQQDLVTQVSEGLRLALSDEERSRIQSVPTRDKEAYADYLQGRAFLERGGPPENLDHAVDLFQAALTKDPDFAMARAGLGEAYWARYEREKDPAWAERARAETEKALELDPDQAAVRRSLAVILTGVGKPEEAIRQLDRAIELEPNNDEGHRLLGEALLAQGETERAMESFQEAVALRPDYWGNYRALGLAYFGKGRYGDAAKAFDRITQLQPDLSLGFQYLGVTYHALGDLESAKRNYEQALKRDPNAAAYANLGTLYYRQGNFAEAAKHYEESLRIAPKSQVNLRNLGDAHRRLGQTSKAEKAYLEALLLTRDQLGVNPNDARLLALSALLEAKLGRNVEAARNADQALAKAPEDGQVLYRRAVVHALAGEDDEAVRLLKSAIEEGFSASEASMDDDLAGLRKRPDFQALINPDTTKGELQ